jgi:hypothetical protein
MTYEAGRIRRRRHVARRDGSFALFVQHEVATMDQHRLALQLEWLESQLGLLGDGREARVIGADGRGWTLTRLLPGPLFTEDEITF